MPGVTEVGVSGLPGRVPKGAPYLGGYTGHLGESSSKLVLTSQGKKQMSIRIGVLRLSQVIKGCAVILPCAGVGLSLFSNRGYLSSIEIVGVTAIGIGVGGALWALAWVMEGFVIKQP